MTAHNLLRKSICGICSASLLLARVTLAQTPASAPAKLPEVSRHNQDAAERLYLEGARELQSSHFPQAEKDFAQAVSLNPTRSEYLQALLLAREHHVTDLIHEAARIHESDPAASDALVEQARKLDPTNPQVVQHTPPPALKPVRTEQLAGLIVLLHNASRHSYHRKGDIRVLAEDMARDYGLRAVLDPDLHTAMYRVDVDDASFTDAMRVLTLVSGTMFVPLDEHTVLLAQDTPENHTRYERMVEETYFLPGFAADELKDFVSIAQNVLEIPKVTLDAGQNAIVVRGPADLTEAAGRIFSDLLVGGNDVVFNIKVYSIDHQHMQNLGVVMPSSFTAYNIAAEAQSIVSANSSLVQQLIANGVIPSGTSTVEIAAYLVFVGGVSGSSALTNTFFAFGGGSTTTGVYTGSTPTLNLVLTNSDARELDDVQLRAGERKDATFKTGVRYPIQTSLFSDIATSTAGTNTSVNGVSLSSLLSQYLGTSSLGSSAVIPQVQYEDIGLTVTANPVVQWTGDISTKLEVKITSLAGTSLNGIPVLSSRQFSSNLTLHDGETTMMISETDRTETSAVTGIPGLSEIPGFQGTTNKSSSLTTGEVVLLVTPHIVRRGHLSPVGPFIPLQTRPDND